MRLIAYSFSICGGFSLKTINYTKQERNALKSPYFLFAQYLYLKTESPEFFYPILLQRPRPFSGTFDFDKRCLSAFQRHKVGKSGAIGYTQLHHEIAPFRIAVYYFPLYVSFKPRPAHIPPCFFLYHAVVKSRFAVTAS